MIRFRVTKSNARAFIIATVLATGVALSLVACGSDESSNANEAASSAAGTSSSDYIVKSSDPVSSSNSEPTAARLPDTQEDDESSPTGAKPVRPCALVTAGEASSILGAPVHAIVGQQGPTCIYTASGSKQTMTLVVEQTSFTALRNHAKNATRIGVGGESGWCLRYGSTSVAVPLPDGRVLAVTGPCAAAARFAARALPRISS
jgi:hypothetical protein